MPRELPRIDYRDHPAYGGMFTPDPAMAAEALAVLNPLIEEARRIEAERAARGGFDFGAAGKVGEQLVEEGVAKVQLDAASMAPIKAAAAPAIQTIRDRIAKARAENSAIRFKTVRYDFGKDADPEVWAAIDAALRDAGVYDITRDYFRARGAKLKGAGILVNQPNQDWANDIFRDADFAAPETAGFHIDSSGKCFIKGVLYLNDVGPDQGPFGMVPGSHRWSEGREERIFRRAYDKSPIVSRQADARQAFISLPEALQVKAEFGGDLLPGSPEALELVRAETVCTGPSGQLNLFNPDGIHRGGNVRSGERIAVLVTAVAQW